MACDTAAAGARLRLAFRSRGAAAAFAVAMLVAMPVAVPARADDPAADGESGWSGRVAAGATVNTGNQESTMLTADLVVDTSGRGSAAISLPG